MCAYHNEVVSVNPTGIATLRSRSTAKAPSPAASSSAGLKRIVKNHKARNTTLITDVVPGPSFQSKCTMLVTIAVTLAVLSQYCKDNIWRVRPDPDVQQLKLKGHTTRGFGLIIASLLIKWTTAAAINT